MDTQTLPASNTAPAAKTKLSPTQWKSGIAAWLGWCFDGLDMHLYTLVALPFVAQLLGTMNTTDSRVGHYAGIINAGFLVGWAVGGGFFGRIADKIGRSKALCLTVLTYAGFTGLSFFAQEWWHLLIFRFMAALGIGGEWAVGASLLSETWPKKWRPWIAAVLQTGVNVGVLLAVLANLMLANYEPRYLFLVGILPALLVLWIRKAVPEPEEWHQAKKNAKREPKIIELFQGAQKRTTSLVIAVCALSLTAHWAFLFWYAQHLRNLPEVLVMSSELKNQLVSKAMYFVITASIVGNFFAAILAKKFGFRRTISFLCFGYFTMLFATYIQPMKYENLFSMYIAIGFFQGVFALFTMYLPPLFPTLLRTTGAGFTYNIGRIAAAAGTVFFGLFQLEGGDYRYTLLYSGMLFVPAGIIALYLPELSSVKHANEPTN
ncbi:MAG: MFS transporter [Verrucomicrobiales bacterium]